MYQRKHIFAMVLVYIRTIEVMESPENAFLWLKTLNYTFRFKLFVSSDQ
jgi:hypothetical protein